MTMHRVRVQVLLFPVTTADCELWFDAASRWLTEPERAHADQIRDPVDRARHVVGRAGLRLLGSGTIGVGDQPGATEAGNGRTGRPIDPRKLEVVTEPSGRPSIANVPSLRVSVAHSDGLVGVASCEHAAIGLDIESTARWQGSHLRIAERLFDEKEVAELSTLSLADRADELIRYWTIKEAIGKAIGTDLRESLSTVILTRTRDCIRVVSVRSEDGSGWTVHCSPAPIAGEVIAVAARSPDAELLPPRVVDMRTFRVGPS